ncbi:hypothetical protein CPB84DRAFT_1789281 [Gymnopilus junonius]|uniref:Uncharacterized protein n=1 Tax=Gymnopilus junonius TaxID=109634 RepID=A0A9P5TJA0_GYMJU|nr:hypothetical protein CPB84DRAFT_1789281 [Gymnopilus junonius]
MFFQWVDGRLVALPVLAFVGATSPVSTFTAVIYSWCTSVEMCIPFLKRRFKISKLFGSNRDPPYAELPPPQDIDQRPVAEKLDLDELSRILASPSSPGRRRHLKNNLHHRETPQTSPYAIPKHALLNPPYSPGYYSRRWRNRHFRAEYDADSFLQTPWQDPNDLEDSHLHPPLNFPYNSPPCPRRRHRRRKHHSRPNCDPHTPPPMPWLNVDHLENSPFNSPYNLPPRYEEWRNSLPERHVGTIPAMPRITEIPLPSGSFNFEPPSEPPSDSPSEPPSEPSSEPATPSPPPSYRISGHRVRFNDPLISSVHQLPALDNNYYDYLPICKILASGILRWDIRSPPGPTTCFFPFPPPPFPFSYQSLNLAELEGFPPRVERILVEFRPP